MVSMQTTLIDKEWYNKVNSLDEANARIAAMLRRLEEAEKIIKKPDYEIVEKLGKIDTKDPDMAKKKIDEIIADVKNSPVSEPKPRKVALFVLPYKDGKPKNRERRRLTYDLTKKNQFEKYAAMGTKTFTRKVHRTQFPAGLKDKDQNCEWLFEPEKLEIIESK